MYLQETAHLLLMKIRTSSRIYLFSPSRTQTKYGFTIGETKITWRSKKQSLVSTFSTHEANIIVNKKEPTKYWKKFDAYRSTQRMLY